jgi:hypothetical protein
MTLDFRKGWDSVPKKFESAPDAAMKKLLTVTKEDIEATIYEALQFGGFNNPVVINMLRAGVSKKGQRVGQLTIREGAHQIEDLPTGGYQVHIGTLFENKNFHLNLGQTSLGTVYITSISWGGAADREKRSTTPPA